MKKFSSFLFAAVLLSSLTACNEKSDIFEGIGILYIIIPLLLVAGLIYYMVSKKRP